MMHRMNALLFIPSYPCTIYKYELRHYVMYIFLHECHQEASPDRSCTWLNHLFQWECWRKKSVRGAGWEGQVNWGGGKRQSHWAWLYLPAHLGKSSESTALYRHFQESMCPGRALQFPVNPSLTEKPQRDEQLAVVVITSVNGLGSVFKCFCKCMYNLHVTVVIVSGAEVLCCVKQVLCFRCFKGWWLKSLTERQPVTYFCLSENLLSQLVT